MDDIDPWQIIRQSFAAARLAGVCRDFDDRITRRLDDQIFHFRFIEQAGLIWRDLLATGRVAFGQGKVQLFLKGKNLRLVTLVLGGESFVASNLISDQGLQCINVIGKLIRCNGHAWVYTKYIGVSATDKNRCVPSTTS